MNGSPESHWKTFRVVGIRASQATVMATALVLLNACGEPVFENVGSWNSLLEDRKACAVEINNSPAATAYRQNSAAHKYYISQVFGDMNRCIESKGWKQARSPQELERVKEAITTEMTRARTSIPITEPEQSEDSPY